MKHINLIRGLGIVCICGAAASFLFEGWNSFNGLEKYLIFFSFITALFTLGEAFKKSSESLDRIFTALFLALSSAITAQLGSFIFDGDSSVNLPAMFAPSPLPDGSPLKFICISSLIFLTSMIFRSTQRLKSTSLMSDLIYLISAQILILLPLRTTEFHALALLAIFVGFMLVEKNVTFTDMDQVSNRLIRIAPFLFLLGRASLYQSNYILEIAECLIVSFICFIYLPSYVKETAVKDISHSVGYICVVLMGHKLSGLHLWSDYEWTLVIVQFLLMIYLISFKKSLKIGFLFTSLVAWYGFLKMVVTPDDMTLLNISINIVFPLAILVLSYSFKYGFGFANSALLLVCVLVHIGYEVIKLPVVNMWMIFGILGISLLLVSFLIEKPHQKLILFFRKTKSFFNQEL